MSASALLASPVDISAMLDDPDALQTAISTQLQANPTVSIPQLATFIESDAVKARMVEEANKGLEAIYTVQNTFFGVLGPLAQVDAGNFKGADGNLIRKFAPEWLGYFKVQTFSVLDAYTELIDVFLLAQTLINNLNKTKLLAGAVRTLITTFTQDILPLLADDTILAAEKQSRIDAFLKLIDANERAICDVDTLVASYDSLSKNVTAFQATFNQTMKDVGKQLDVDIQRAQQDIADVKARIAAHVEAGKKLGLTAGVLGTVAGGLSATGILAPFALIFTGLAIFFGISEAQKYYDKSQKLKEELTSDENALATLNANKATYDSLQPEIYNTSKDMDTITVKLAALTTIFKTLKADVVSANEHLGFAESAHDADIGDIRNSEIKLAAASYANLNLLLDTFAVGWRE
ncbi:hypothetical protein B0H11DRAFT_2224474 [Mycena galericulata]|nr:hypothetical protein B0H11DRAFT_2224474 [Mycena galericulata]